VLSHGFDSKVAWFTAEMEAPLMAPQSTDQEIAEQVSKEMDSAKLTILVDRLCRALDEHHKSPLVQ
jgi:hypothetical protein